MNQSIHFFFLYLAYIAEGDLFYFRLIPFIDSKLLTNSNTLDSMLTKMTIRMVLANKHKNAFKIVTLNWIRYILAN